MSRAADPKWTAFVLGELETSERDSILEALERDPTVLENVERDWRDCHAHLGVIGGRLVYGTHRISNERPFLPR